MMFNTVEVALDQPDPAPTLQLGWIGKFLIYTCCWPIIQLYHSITKRRVRIRPSWSKSTNSSTIKIIPNSDGLLVAIRSNNVSAVSAILASHTARSAAELVNSRTGGWYSTPLMEASYKGSIAICQLLIAAGADIAAVDRQGNSALLRAAVWNHTDIVEYYITKCYNTILYTDLIDINNNNNNNNNITMNQFQRATMDKSNIRTAIIQAQRKLINQYLIPVLIPPISTDIALLPIPDLINIIVQYLF